MTAEELREKKKLLLAKKRRIIDKENFGETEELALFVVQEELLEVNAQLRALTVGKRVGKQRISHNGWDIDWATHKTWGELEAACDEDMTRKIRLEVLRAKKCVTPHQKAVLELKELGLSNKLIAEALFINESNVWRTLKRAEKNIRAECERRQRQVEGGYGGEIVPAETVLDISDSEICGKVLSVLTETQAMYIYLYYSEWLTLREIEKLCGTDQSAVSRTIRRGLGRIQTELGEKVGAIEHLEVWDEILFELYCKIEHAEDEEKICERRRKNAERKKKYPMKKRTDILPYILCKSRLGALFERGQVPREEHGLLYTALTERKNVREFVKTMLSLFREWKKKIFVGE